MLRKYVITTVAGLLLVGCVSVPPEAYQISEKIGAGMESTEKNTMVIIAALEQASILAAQNDFDSVRDKIESIYRAKRAKPSPAKLDDEDNKNIAALMVITYGKITDKIREQTNALRKQTQDNDKVLMGANAELSSFLKSASQATIAQKALVSTAVGAIPGLGDLAGGIQAFVKKISGDAVTEVGQAL